MRIVIIGAGGFGREVLDIVEALATSADLECAGYVDDGNVRDDLLERRGMRHLGVTDDVPRLGLPYVVGIGSGAVRGRIVARLDATGCTAITLVHPAATVGGDVRVAEGVIIAAGARA